METTSSSCHLGATLYYGTFVHKVSNCLIQLTFAFSERANPSSNVAAVLLSAAMLRFELLTINCKMEFNCSELIGR